MAVDKLVDSLNRCAWVTKDPIYIDYHDQEWGVPVFDDRLLFEFLILEGAQAGLSWLTVLKKREHYRRVFDHFVPEKIVHYSKKKIEQLLSDPGIIRNRLKVNATVTNAEAYLRVLEAESTFSDYLWQFVDGAPIQNRWKRTEEVPASTPLSDALSEDLKRRGFSFVGSTICYAFMQAVGMVNDHTTNCFRYSRRVKTGDAKRD